jgi:hypothetical protein
LSRSTHAGKTPEERQQYSDAIAEKASEVTVPDKYSVPDSSASNVPEPYNTKGLKAAPLGKRRRQKGINSHFQKYFHTYIITIMVLLIPLAYTIVLNTTRSSDQIQAQKDTISKLQQEIDQLKNDSQSNAMDLQVKLDDYTLKIQEQALRIQFLEKLLQNPKP